jgi:hypothetical protein
MYVMMLEWCGGTYEIGLFAFLRRELTMMKHITFALAVVVALAVLTPAHAGFFMDTLHGSHFVGNSSMYLPDSTADGTVNFAVYNNTAGGDWSVALGVNAKDIATNLIGAPDVNAKYVYFYQVVNDSFHAGTLALEHLFVTPGLFDSGGYLTKTASGSEKNAIFSAAYLGARTDDDTPGNGIPGNDSGVLTGTSADFAQGTQALVSGVNTATVRPIALQLSNGFYDFTFTNIIDGKVSAVVFLTSDRAPTYLLGAIQDFNAHAQGDMPSNTPEPASVVTLTGALATGLIGLVIAASKKRRR